MIRLSMAASLTFAFLLANSPSQATATVPKDSAPADAIAERMLQALGGRAAWSQLTTLINDSQQNRTEEPTVVRATIALDLTRLRFRIETTAPDLHLIRVIDGDRDWRLSRSGQVEALPAENRARDLAWHSGHLYRTIHRIAKRDPSLRLELDAQQRLLVREGTARLLWLKLDDRGEPFAFGSHDDESGSLAGPWTVLSGGIKHPAWTALADGSFRAQLVSLQTNVPLPDQWFARPMRVASFAQLAGEWQGTGQFRGAATSITLTLGPILDGRFHRLQIALRRPGATSAFFSGDAYYRRTLDGVVATWFDSTGNSYPVGALVDGACLRAEWTPSVGTPGRSSYCLGDDGKLSVVDEIRTQQAEWRRFAQYELTKHR